MLRCETPWETGSTRLPVWDQIFFHGPGRLDVGGFLHRRVKAHGEAQRQDGLADIGIRDEWHPEF